MYCWYRTHWEITGRQGLRQRSASSGCWLMPNSSKATWALPDCSIKSHMSPPRIRTFKCPFLIDRLDNFASKECSLVKKTSPSSSTAQSKLQLIDSFLLTLSLTHAMHGEFFLNYLPSTFTLYYLRHIVWIDRCSMDEVRQFFWHYSHIDNDVMNGFHLFRGAGHWNVYVALQTGVQCDRRPKSLFAEINMSMSFSGGGGINKRKKASQIKIFTRQIQDS